MSLKPSCLFGELSIPRADSSGQDPVLLLCVRAVHTQLSLYMRAVSTSTTVLLYEDRVSSYPGMTVLHAETMLWEPKPLDSLSSPDEHKQC